MNLAAYTATALSRNDITDTPTNKNIVDGAIVELKDLDGNLVVIYDDAAGANPETQKSCDANGQLTFWAEVGDYALEVNSKVSFITIGASVKFTRQSRQAIEAVYKAQGYNNVFFFEDGFTYTESNDVAIYEDGTAWTYTDAGALPVTIAAGTVPSEGVYSKVKVKYLYKSVSDMIQASLSVGDYVKTEGRNFAGDGGSANYLVVEDNTYTDGVDGHHEGYDYFQGVGYQIGISHNGVVFPEQFGWVGDWDGTTGTDNTLAINNMISYCAPFDWKGSIAATKAAMGNVRAKIIGGVGQARITDSVILNPSVTWEGLKKGVFFGDNGGTFMVADFDSLTKYVVDTAPMIADGLRPLGATYQRAAWDGSQSAGCRGWSLSHVGFGVATGRVVKGAMNRQIAIQSSVEHCNIGGNGGGECFEGIKNSVCWGGNLSNNHIVGSAYAIRNEFDVTTDMQENNYCTVRKSIPKPSESDYAYMPWPDTVLFGKSACVISRFADPHLYSNTYEGGELGVAATSSSQISDQEGYFEGISDYIYAAVSVNLSAKPKWCIATADLLYLSGGSTTEADIDLTSCSYFQVNSFGTIYSATKGLSLTGSFMAAGLPWSANVNYRDIDVKGTVAIYVSSTGDDTKSGYTLSNAVETIQEAIARCKKGVSNKIVISSGDSVATKYQFLSGNATNTSVSGLDMEIIGGTGSKILVSSSSNQTHCLPVEDCNVTVRGVEIDLTNAADTGSYTSFLRARGVVDYVVKDCNVTGSGTLFGAQFGTPAHSKISMSNTDLGGSILLTSNGGESKLFSWIETSRGITSNAVVGSGVDGKIFSTLFP